LPLDLDHAAGNFASDVVVGRSKWPTNQTLSGVCAAVGVAGSIWTSLISSHGKKKSSLSPSHRTSPLLSLSPLQRRRGCGGARRCGCLGRTPAPARAPRRRRPTAGPASRRRAPDDGSTAPVDLVVKVSWGLGAMRWRRGGGGRPAVPHRASFPTPPVTTNAARRPLPPPLERTATGLLTACRAAAPVAPAASSPVRPRMGDVRDWLAPGACGLRIPQLVVLQPFLLPFRWCARVRGVAAARRRGSRRRIIRVEDHGCRAQAGVNAEGRVQVHLFPSDSPIPEVLIAGSWQDK
ncbi:unnamed protein product, partial [Urochloa humidicola]